MQLRDAIKEFSFKRATRHAFPKSAAINRVCGKFEETGRPSKEIERERIKRITGAFANGVQASLRRRDLRFIASSIGSEGVGQPKIIGLILEEVKRRADRRLYRVLFISLLNNYRDAELRRSIGSLLAADLDLLTPDAKRFVEASGVLKESDGLLGFAKRLLSGKDIYSACMASGVNSRILLSSYGTELKLAVLRTMIRTEEPETVKVCLNWAVRGIQGIPIGDYYEAVLSPFEEAAPQSDLQQILISWLIEEYKDPRLHLWPIPLGKNGEARREWCVSILKRWLSIQYLDLFIDIIETTAVDRQFRPRKAFWLKYFEQDKISDVTLILASEADRVARKMRAKFDDADYMQWARLGQASSDQSVLLMRLGDLIIAEWSHNGAIRFWKADGKDSPKFHLREYAGPELRRNSLRVKVGAESRDSIIHHENGIWMRWAAAAIRRFTGVTV